MWYFASTGVVVTWSSYGELQANGQDYLSTFSIVCNKSTHIRPGNLHKKKGGGTGRKQACTLIEDGPRKRLA